MRLRTLAPGLAVLALLSHILSAADEPANLATDVLADGHRVLENDRSSCDDLAGIALRISDAGANNPSLASLGNRIDRRRSKIGCAPPKPARKKNPGDGGADASPSPTESRAPVQGGAPATRAPKKTEDPPISEPLKKERLLQLRADLLREVKQLGTTPKAGAAAVELHEKQKELASLSISILREQKLKLDESVEIENSLGIALADGVATTSLLSIIKNRALNDDDIAELIVIIAHDKDANSIRRIADLLDQLTSANLNDKEAAELTRTAIRALQKSAGNAKRAAELLEAETLLLDDRKRQALTMALNVVEARYGKLEERGQNLRDIVENKVPPEIAVSKFFNFIDPVMLAQLSMESHAAKSMSPEREPIQFMRLFVQMPTQPSSPSCTPGSHFVTAFMKTIHFNYGPTSGVRLSAQLDSSKITELRAWAPSFMATTDQARAKREQRCAGLKQDDTLGNELCIYPYPGIVLLRFEKADQRWRVSATGWTKENPAERAFGEEVYIPTTCAQAEEETAAFRLASATIDACVSLKLPVRPKCETCRFTQDDASPWNALLFASLPYIEDRRATPMSKIVPTVIDIALIAAAGFSVGQAVKYRNDYASGNTAALDDANAALTRVAGFGIGLAVVRIGSGVAYAAWPDLWQRSER